MAKSVVVELVDLGCVACGFLKADCRTTPERTFIGALYIGAASRKMNLCARHLTMFRDLVAVMGGMEQPRGEETKRDG